MTLIDDWAIKMRIRKIEIKRLFHLFDHEVPLNLEERITIIHGPNGLGKTALLRLINAFFNQRWSELLEIPFESFSLDLDDGSNVRILTASRKQKESTKEKGLAFAYSSKAGVQEEYFFIPERADDANPKVRHLAFDLSSQIAGLEVVRVNERTLLRYMPSGELLTVNEVLARFRDYLPPYFAEFQADSLPPWLRTMTASLNVHFIQAQRLVSIREKKPIHSPGELRVTPSVQVYSREITRALKDTLTEYGELSQSLDRTFPERLMRQNRKKNLSIDELKKRLAALEQKRRALESTGLLEEEQGGRFEMPETIDPTTQNTLSVYVQDNERKLGVFDAIAAKIDLLRQTVDHHFLYKTMIINKESGFLFAAKSGRPLSPTNLSSGEQNQLVLLYELLFKVKSNSLILIDEPEISFHVAWQLQFLKDLQQIIRLSEFDVLIATHSPQVINDRWDLTVELNGPAENDQ